MLATCFVEEISSVVDGVMSIIMIITTMNGE